MPAVNLLHNHVSGSTAPVQGVLGTSERSDIPNHLLDTMIFPKKGVCDNDIFNCRPPAIHFQGFNLGKRYSQKLRITNVSSECQRLHVIPPSSLPGIFNIRYDKSNSLAPGMHLNVTVELFLQSNMFYSDCIRIHSKSATNIIIPIYAYLTLDLTNFPKRIQFKPTEVGHTVVKKIPLRNKKSIDFGFQIIIVQENPVFDIYPMSGTILANSHIDIIIKYSPREYCTSTINIQITVSQFSCEPYTCTITGTSAPGITTKLISDSILSTDTLDPKSISALGRSRSKKQISQNYGMKHLNTDKNEGEFTMKNEGKDIMKNTLTKEESASQQFGKTPIDDSCFKNQREVSGTSKKMKENLFVQIISRNVAEEYRNQLRWGVKLGESPISKKKQEYILKQRERHIEEYHTFVGKLKDEKAEFQRHILQINEDKVIRSANSQSSFQPTFDIYDNDDWVKRQLVLGKFILVARKIIWLLRATKQINTMKRYLSEWRRGNFKLFTQRLLDEDTIERTLVENLTLDVIGSNLLPFSFPENIPESSRSSRNVCSQLENETAVDALRTLPVYTTSIKRHSNVELFNLKVPLQFKLLHYNMQPISTATRKYIPKVLSRKLRNGPQVEIIQPQKQEDEVDNQKESDVLQILNRTISPPSYFLESKKYRPMHVFNPIPGVYCHIKDIPYSEVDDDYSLSPLYRPTTSKNLKRVGVIPGVMNWRNFPSHSLAVMGSIPSLYDVYVPRWSNPFDEELMPTKTPALLTSLPDKDEINNLQTDNVLIEVVPNMDMVCAEFILVGGDISEESNELHFCNNIQSSYGMICRGTMKEKLNRHLQMQMNSLGDRIHNYYDDTVIS